jgi:hypothetical protein
MLVFILHARLRVHQAPGFPAPSAFRGQGISWQTSGVSRGENAKSYLLFEN